jgi:hypothetical protein
MWVFTKYGFYSAVCARAGTGQHHEPVDPQRMMIRSRLRSHLEAILKRFPVQLSGLGIQEFPGSDYAYRLFVDKAIWVEVLADLADETDYDNFKDAVAGHLGAAGRAYGRSLHEVWGVMHRLQQ